MDARLSIHLEENQRRFLFSGIPASLEKSLAQKIESLHGKLLNPVKDTFPINCTHVIALEFQTTEKILGALAGGKWLLSAKYILDSYKEGRWLKEEGYELPDFNELATYHRQERMLKGYGLYAGWKILVLLNPSVSRKFKRILVAGGAEIALKDDSSVIDFVVTNKEMLDHAKSVVDSIRPLVDVSFIRSTLILRHDPVDLKTFDLRHNPMLETSRISTVRTTSVSSGKSSSHGGKKSSEIQRANSPLDKKGKLYHRFKQTSLTQFIKREVFEVKKPSSDHNICDRRQRALGKKDLLDNNVPKSRHSNNTLSSASVVDVENKKDISQNGDSLERNDTNQKKQAERRIFEDRTLVNIPVMYEVNDDIQNQGLNSKEPDDIQQIEKNTSEGITSVNASSVTKKVNRNLQNQYGEKSNSTREIETKKCVSKDVTPASISSGVPSVESNTHNVALKEFHICLGQKINLVRDPNLFGKSPLTNCDCINSYSKNPPEEVKNWLPKITRTTSEQREKCVMMNPVRLMRKKSLDSVSEQVLHRKEAVSLDSPVHTITKEHIWKVVVQFLRTRNDLNGICSNNCLIIPRGTENFPNLRYETLDSDIDSQQVLDGPNYQHKSHEPRELTSRELHFYTCCTEVDDTVNEKELLVNAMETLLLQVSPYVYPPPSILGSLLKNFVIETRFSMVHSRALRIAYMILTLHPPASAKMQAYYLHALKHAMKPNDFGSYIPWKFVQHCIQLAACMESYEASCFNQNSEEEEEEVLDKATKALHLLEFIVLLLTEDVRHSTYGEGVQDLLTWQIFCGTSEKCHVLKSPVKELIKLWMSPQTTSPALQCQLSQLISVVLEALWKFSGQPLLPVDTLPTSLAAVQKEMQISFKGLRSEEHMMLIWSLPTPWAQAVVSFMIVQKNVQCPTRITLLYCVKIRNPDGGIERQNRMELFLTLANCYLENSCNRYIRLRIQKIMSELLKNTETRKRKKDGVFTLSLTKNCCQTSKDEETEARKCMPQYLNLLGEECSQELNELEKTAVDKIFSCIKQDKDVFSKWSRYDLSPGKIIDSRQFFETLCR